MLYAEFPARQAQPFVVLTSRVQTQNRSINWSQKTALVEDPATLNYFTRATTLIPTDGIVRSTALAATQGAKSDVEKALMLHGLDRRQHLPRTQSARLRRRRHQNHAGNCQPGRQVR